jgi:plasmid stabilization system protein ParE
VTPHRLVVVTARAAAEIDAAADWWSRNRPAARDALREDLTRALELLAEQPRVGAVARGTRLPGVRRVHLSRVRYHVY